MGKSVSQDQSHAVIATLQTNVDWSVLDGDALQEQIIKKPKEAGKQFTAFLKNGARVIVGEPKIITIDRSQPFDPVKFFGKSWSIDEQDEHSLALAEIDLTKVRLETMFEGNETSIKGEEKLRRLKKAGHIRLDAKIFQTLWENQALIPERFKEKVVYFDGTVLRDPDGRRCVLCLYWGVGRWYWGCHWLEDGWGASVPSAVLASI